jgi:protocatechuate 3,4-dioxygenase alpha subunit
MRTPSQTVGPFFSFGLCDRPRHELPGGSVRLVGRVLDGEGVPVPDAMVELWSPDAGFGRAGTDAEGSYSFLVPDGFARLEVMVFARGLLKPVVTRLYPPGATGAEDATMVAADDGDGLRFDVRLQGDGETAFFEL